MSTESAENSEKNTKDELVLPMGFNKNLDKDQQDYLSAFYVQYYSGPKVVPIRCSSDCIYRGDCPYVRINAKPEDGQPCQVEKDWQELWFKQLIDRLGIDDLFSVDAMVVREFVNWQVQEMRYSAEFAGRPTAIIQTIRGVDDRGQPIYDMKPNPVLKSMKEASNRKGVLLKSLVATRQEQMKLDQRRRDDPTVVTAEAIAKLAELKMAAKEKRKQLESRGGSLEEEVIDAEFEEKK